MTRLEPIATPDGLGRLLASGVASGKWTLEDLDTPSPGWQRTEEERTRAQTPLDPDNPTHKVPCHTDEQGKVYEGFPRPAIKYPMGKDEANSEKIPTHPGKPWSNPAREWIEKHPREWQKLLAKHQPEPAPQAAQPKAKPFPHTSEPIPF